KFNRGSAYVRQLPDYGATSCADGAHIMNRSKLRKRRLWVRRRNFSSLSSVQSPLGAARRRITYSKRIDQWVRNNRFPAGRAVEEKRQSTAALQNAIASHRAASDQR